MRKFFVMLKKEIVEMLTPQMLLPMLIMALVFVLVGKVIGSETKNYQGSQSIIVIDNDLTPSSQEVIESLSDHRFRVLLYQGVDVEKAIADSEREAGPTAIIHLPSGFEEGILRYEPPKIEAYSILQSLSLLGSMGANTLQQALSLITNDLSNKLIRERISDVDPETIKKPIRVSDFVVIHHRKANIHPNTVMGFVSSQTTFIPVILFMVMIYASQMIVTAIAAEKENKTLETLLTVPIRRGAMVTAKMTAAGLMALMIATVYMFGFRYYISGIIGDPTSMGGPEVSAAFKELGLVLDPVGYALLGLSIFFGILCALAISFTLGSFAEDLKSAQGLITPLIFMVMIPYFLILFLDFNTLSPLIRWILYAIPFSHPFMAAPNLFLHNYEKVLYGIGYEILFFAVFVYIATKIFSSDRILTMKLRLKRSR